MQGCDREPNHNEPSLLNIIFYLLKYGRYPNDTRCLEKRDVVAKVNFVFSRIPSSEMKFELSGILLPLLREGEIESLDLEKMAEGVDDLNWEFLGSRSVRVRQNQDLRPS